MRTQTDYVIDKIRFHSQSHQEKSTERYFTATSTPAPGENELHGTFSPSTQGPSCQTYEIVMVSLCGSIFLLAVVVIALKAIRKRVLHVQRWRKRDRQFITTDSCSRNRASKPRTVSQKPEATSQEVKTIEGKPSSPSKELAASETVVANIVTKHDGDKIFTAQINGPAYIRYISDTEEPPITVLAPEGKPDSNTTLAFSFTSSISPLNTSPKQ